MRRSVAEVLFVITVASIRLSITLKHMVDLYDRSGKSLLAFFLPGVTVALAFHLSGVRKAEKRRVLKFRTWSLNEIVIPLKISAHLYSNVRFSKTLEIVFIRLK